MSRPTQYKVSFIPYETLQYDYVVEAKDEDEEVYKVEEISNGQ
jgi:hypothetical protein